MIKAKDVFYKVLVKKIKEEKEFIKMLLKT